MNHYSQSNQEIDDFVIYIYVWDSASAMQLTYLQKYLSTNN